MENAADALKMAAWVLIFVVALSIIINAFGMEMTLGNVLFASTTNIIQIMLNREVLKEK